MSQNKLVSERCICQICTCGRHRCPHNRGSIGSAPVQQDAKCHITEYQKAFETWPYQPRRESLRPAVRAPMDDIPMDIHTTYQNTYKKHDPQADIRKVKYQYTPPQTKMDNESTYVTEYTAKNGTRPVSFKPKVSYEGNKTPFSTGTMYKENFVEVSPESMAMARSNPVKHKECIEMSSDKLDATTVMKNDFINHKNPARVGLIRPQQQEREKTSRFDSDTTYKTEYTEKTPDRASAKPKEGYKANTSPFAGETTAKSDYKGWPDHKREASFKPHVVYRPCDIKFVNCTTASDAFKHWPARQLEKPKWGHLAKYTAPTVAIKGHSSYQEDYVRPESHTRTQPVKPKQNDLYFEKDNSNIATHYQENFIGYTGHEKPPSFKKTHVYEEPPEPFIAESIYQHNYKGEHSERAKLCGPKSNNLGRSRAKLKTATTYNEEYKKHTNRQCPAKELARGSEGLVTGVQRNISSATYTLKSMKNGHQYYAHGVKKEVEEKSKAANTVSTNTEKKQSSANSSGVKFNNFAETMNSQRRRSSIKVKEAHEAKKIERVATPPASPEKKSSVDCTCKPGMKKQQSINKSVARCTC